ncbi:MAG: hypothetical protein P1V81_09925 [Planctomycetota bacterium]|nr:hypothetical protein [Planctomycetota bacterium]
MKTLPNPLLFLLPILAPAALGLAPSDPPYRFTDLGTLGGAESAAFGLNDAGAVVGWSTIPGCTTMNGTPCRRAFLWQDGTMTDLGTLAGDEESTARAINDLGQIVGTSESNVIHGSGTYHGVTWTGPGPVALADLGNGTSFAHDINNSGDIAGHAYDPSVSADRAVRWQAGAPMNLGSTQGDSYNRAYGINELGHLAGFAWNLFSPNDAVLYDGKWSTIGGTDSPWQNAEAYDVSTAGHKVGLQAFPSGSWHPAYWAPGAKSATDVGLLPGHNLGELHDVNESGFAVGRTYMDSPPFESSAITFDGSTMRDLNDHLPSGVSAHLFEAREVNEAGAIAGTAVVGGLFHAFLLEPLTPWANLGGGLAGGSGKAPTLEGFGELEGAGRVELRAANMPVATPLVIVAGAAKIDIPFLGGILAPSPDFLFAPQLSDAAGEAALGFDWPVGVLPGTPTYWQAWVFDATGPVGFTATNAVTATTL